MRCARASSTSTPHAGTWTSFPRSWRAPAAFSIANFARRASARRRPSPRTPRRRPMQLGTQRDLVLAGAVFASVLGATALARAAADPDPLAALEWRNIGPSRGGRVTAVTGVPGQRNVYYFGGTGSGVWKSTDSGVSWLNLSDGYFATGSVGAIEVAPSDPNVIYAGMGEACIRGNVSHGDGVYKSVDGGR